MVFQEGETTPEENFWIGSLAIFVNLVFFTLLFNAFNINSESPKDLILLNLIAPAFGLFLLGIYIFKKLKLRFYEWKDKV